MKAAGKSLPSDNVIIANPSMVESIVAQAEAMNKIIMFATSFKDEPSTISKSIQLAFDEMILVVHVTNPGEEFLNQLGSPRVPGYALFLRMKTDVGEQAQFQVINYN